MEKNKEKDGEKKTEEEESAWFEKRSDGTAWYESFSKREIPTQEDENVAPALPVFPGNGIKDSALSVPQGRVSQEKEASAIEKSVSADEEPPCFAAEKREAYGKAADESKKEVFEKKRENAAEETLSADEKNGWSLEDLEEKIKIYLPDPPPKQKAQEISDLRAYIEKAFTGNRTIETAKRKKSRTRVCEIFGVTAIIVGFLTLSTQMAALGLILLLTGIVLTAIMVIKGDRQYLFTDNLEEFRLIIPHAVRKEYPADVNTHTESAYKNKRNAALLLYYRDDAEERRAKTEALYSQSELDGFIAAFQKGELVAVCRKSNFWGDAAVICEPAVSDVRHEGPQE